MSKSPARKRLLTVSVAAVAVSTTLAVGASPAAAHRSTADSKRLSEKKLRALETRTIGPVHAAQHAAQRADLRSPRARARRARAERAARSSSLRARSSALADAAEIGRWADPTTLPSVAIHSAVLSTGKVLFFGSVNRVVTLWDPKTGTSKTLESPKAADGTVANLFCAGQSFLADGRLLVTGGQLEGAAGPGTTYKGLNTVFTFDPLTEKWTRHPNMRDGRWYPTQVLLPDGRTAIMDGLDASGVEGRDANNDIEIFTPAAKRDEPGTISQLGRRGELGQPPKGALYPHMFLMPSGRTLVAGPQESDSWFLESLGSGLAFNWTDTDNPENHFFGTGVILPKSTPGSTEVALIGGDRSSQVETFDEARPQDGWTTRSPLQQSRGHHNTVLLPDGSMVTVGGGIGLSNGSLSQFETGHLDAELWNPATRTWRRAAAQQEGRAYHSTALLLPDGRVMSAGDDANGQGGSQTDTAEVYSPPYLFNAGGGAAVRPAVASAPGRTDYGQSFSVGFAGSDVARAVLIAPGAVTHSNDMSQRYVPLALSNNGAGSATLTAPANANHAPPGRYMLFLINAAGVPSEARFMQVGSPAEPPEPTPTPTPTATPTATATPTPTPTPVPGTGTGTSTGSPPTSGTTPATPASSLGLSVGKRQTVGTVRERGLRSTTRCSGGCTIRAELRLDRRTAVKLRLVSRSSRSAPVVIGRGSVTLQKATDGRLVVALTRSAKRQFRRTRSISVRLTLVATHSGGKRQTLTRRLTLRR